MPHTLTFVATDYIVELVRGFNDLVGGMTLYGETMERASFRTA